MPIRSCISNNGGSVNKLWTYIYCLLLIMSNNDKKFETFSMQIEETIHISIVSL